MQSETSLIDRYFRDLGAQRADVMLGIGDDAALLRAPAGEELVLTTDALVEGVHFLPGAPPRSLGHRALAVNLSDIAAMGAEARWALLSLNLPRADEAWLAEFAAGFGALARRYGVALVGGNMSRGPLSITVQMAGGVPAGQALRRDGASAGDLLYVSGSVGDAAAGLRVLRGEIQPETPIGQFLRERFEYPEPRLALGAALRGIASACIDVSDGLYVDTQRLLRSSGCGARIELNLLPLSSALREVLGPGAWRQALDGGEDYELCFSAAPGNTQAVEAAAVRAATAVSCIGTLTAASGIQLRDGNSVMQFSPFGFDHFRD